jgi:hypothetical protein
LINSTKSAVATTQTESCIAQADVATTQTESCIAQADVATTQTESCIAQADDATIRTDLANEKALVVLHEKSLSSGRSREGILLERLKKMELVIY